MERTFPGTEWQLRAPEELGLSAERLQRAEDWMLDAAHERPFRVVVARHGYLATEWNHGVQVGERLPLASAAKASYSCLLGIAVEEGMIPSTNARVVDYYPEMMDVREGEGPKPGRHAFQENQDIRFRQLICNTSGYMKPGEQPGKQFHYQTFGMNILTNALATIYGYYDSKSSEALPGCARLMENKIRDPIGGSWSHSYKDFEYGPHAKKNIFGHFLQIVATARDMARIGHLWLNWGQWNGRQVVPAQYLRYATVTNADILANEPEENWRFGHGFWVNDHGKQWPELPRDSYAAWGGGGMHIWVCPSLDLVVTQSPGPGGDIRPENPRLQHEQEVLSRILDAVVA